MAFFFPAYENIGCFKDKARRAIKSLEGKDPILDGSYRTRVNPIAKCAVAAERKRYNMFAVQNGGQCSGGILVAKTYDRYGRSTACRTDGGGGAWANQVYKFKGK